MRFLLPLCLALAACSSDPAPPADAGPADTGAPVDLGHDVLALDVTEDRPAPVDVPGDQGVDAVVKDWPFADTGSDAPSDVAADVPADVACNADAGRCIDLQTDVMNCGALGRACEVQNATPQCHDGVCDVGMCAAPWGNCDRIVGVGNGCEVDLSRDVTNCGACGTRCAARQSCVGGVCRF
ncbi:MAG: hypothetical protein Q8S73_36965 [Deltaproteobacteria bacterium]|nr:hypothetical protein [Myxococcales bacterium]MDP3219752.1 hypothetical protein [Deltaproteobacteria bacterium]